MTRWFCILLGVMAIASRPLAPLGAQAPADAAFHSVSYVEASASARTTMVGAMKQYRDASRKEDGSVRIDLFEQIGWPGHFVVVETWRDAKAFDAHAMASAAKQFQDAMQPIRVSGYDQRPYKTLTVAAPAGAG